MGPSGDPDALENKMLGSHACQGLAGALLILHGMFRRTACGRVENTEYPPRIMDVGTSHWISIGCKQAGRQAYKLELYGAAPGLLIRHCQGAYTACIYCTSRYYYDGASAPCFF